MYTDPAVEEDTVQGCEKTSFNNLLKESDVISIHVHLNKETENMFNAETFKKMKKEAHLVNTARGGIVDENALLDVLKGGFIAGYATDVLADELSFNTGFKSYPLVEYAKDHRNVIIAPHIGGMTVESRERTDIFIAEKLKKFLLKK